MDRFLLASNPLHESGTYIIHTIKPIAIIECVNEIKITTTKPYRLFNIGNKTFALIVYFVDQEQDPEKVEKLLNRAWHWYRAYLETKNKQ